MADSSLKDSNYAVVRISGRQYRVSPGQKIKVETLEGDNKSVTFKEVLLFSDGTKTTVGKPLVSGASVTAKVLGTVKDKKVIIYKKKRTTGYTKKQGHRQVKTELLIEAVNG